MSQIAIINGPNLNLIGIRQPEIYGDISFDEYIPQLRFLFPELDFTYFQSNHEGFIIDELHRVGYQCKGIILNAGGLSHTSISIADAVSAITAPVVELHISDIYQREPFRHHTYLKAVCDYHVIGKGMQGYQEAIEWILSQ